MPVEVILPKVDMDMATGKIARWFVDEGQPVAKGAPLFEIETDKAAMDVEAPASGILRGVTGGEGVDIPVGEVVAWIYADGEASEAAAANRATENIPAPARVPDSDSKVVPENALAAVLTGNAAPAAHSDSSTTIVGTVRATPLARRLARQRGLDLSKLSGSGPNGRIHGRDVEAAADARSSRPDVTGTAVMDRSSAGVVGAGTGAPVLHAEWLRPGEGAPVVLLHGFGAEIGSWRPLLPGFHQGTGVLGIDLPGHGKSVGVEAGSFAEIAETVEEALRSLGIGAAHLVGHSLGGAVATAIAAGGQLDIRSLLLLAPAGLGPEIDSAFVAGFAAATEEPAVRAWMSKLVADPSNLPDGFVRAAARGRADGRLSAAQTRLGAALFSNNTQLFSTRSMFADLAMPTKVVVGLEDAIIPSHQALGLPGHIALHRFPATGHMPQLEQREAVSRLLAELVA